VSTRRVPLWQQPRSFTTVEDGATRGAVIGRNVWNDDGSLFEPAAAATPAQGNDVAVTLWRLVREIPLNVKALELAEGAGLFAVTGDGTGAFRTLADTETIGWTNGDGVAGNPAASLKDLADSGAGTFKLLTRDAKGRLSGTADGDTDDVSEGANNLYFTAARVRDTILAGLSTATNVAIAATDSVLSALGKLQAQITALASTVSDLITQTITNGDTTHAPSGDAVFDALAGKFDKSGGAISGTTSVTGDLNVARPAVPAQAYNMTMAGAGNQFNSYSATTASKFLTLNSTTDPANTPPSSGNIGVRFATMGTGRWVVQDGFFGPVADNAYDLAQSGNRIREIFAANGTINTSDARDKTSPIDLSPAELAAAAELARLPCRWQWLESVAEKGEAARWHFGPTVQAVIAVMQAHGLDVRATDSRYAFICYDQWGETPEVKDAESGEVTQEYRPAGDRYSLRPTELAHFVMRGLAWRQDQIEARLAALEP